MGLHPESLEGDDLLAELSIDTVEIGKSIAETREGEFEIEFPAEGLKGACPGNLWAFVEGSGGFVVEYFGHPQRLFLSFGQIADGSAPVDGDVILRQDLQVFLPRFGRNPDFDVLL